jgi:hypothetical protein
MWLDPIKKSGAAVPRVTLVERALNDTALLHFICKGAQKLGAKGPAASSTYLGFYSVTLCEAVQTAKVRRSDKGEGVRVNASKSEEEVL